MQLEKLKVKSNTQFCYSDGVGRYGKRLSNHFWNDFSINKYCEKLLISEIKDLNQ